MLYDVLLSKNFRLMLLPILNAIDNERYELPVTRNVFNACHTWTTATGGYLYRQNSLNQNHLDTLIKNIFYLQHIWFLHFAIEKIMYETAHMTAS